MPRWLVTLQMAESWGMSPWEIERAPGSLMWAARWSVYQEEKAKAIADARPKPKKGSA